MRLSERTRRWSMRLLWAALLVAVSLLLGLRLGRPLYYTDGAQQVAAGDLASGGMVRWNTPDAVVELPGPVQGRVAALPDGRLVYGRTMDGGTTDLVVFDPAHPQVPPEPAYGLNTAHNELAPAVADGRIFFASDRPDGVGGYDLYVAAVTAAGFGAPVPLAVCNTAQDETDPAPTADGRELVFVRIDATVADGRGGDLWRVRLDSGLDPTPVFALHKATRTAFVADRDPAFAADGSALWFVRQTSGTTPTLLRSSRLAEQFDRPLRIGAAWGTTSLRAPLPSADGRSVGLLQPGRGGEHSDLWLRSANEELPPWWPGQRWLEWLLLGVAGCCALLLLLLHLGRRWSTLDFVAQCLLLSLLLHVLLFLWLMGVEIAGSPLPGHDDEGRLQVMVVASTADAAAAANGTEASDVAAQVQFDLTPRALAATAPAAAPLDVDSQRRIAAADAEWQRDLAAGEPDAAAQLQDRAAEPERRREVAVATTPLPAAIPAADRAATAAAAARAAARTAAGVDAVRVDVPQAAVAHREPLRSVMTAPVAVSMAAPTEQVVGAATVADTSAALPVRAEAGNEAALAADATAITAAAPVGPSAARTSAELASTGGFDVAAPAAALPHDATRTPAAPPVLATSAPTAQAHRAAAAVRDASPPPTPSTPAAATSAATTLAAAAVAAVVPEALGVTVARDQGAVAPSAAVAAVTPPDTELARSTQNVRAPAAGRLVEGVPPAPVPATAAVVLRDRPAAVAAPASAARSAAVDAPGVALDTPVAEVGAAAAALRAPERGLVRERPEQAIALPGSQLAREAASTMPLASGAGAPSAPQPAARAVPRIAVHDGPAATAVPVAAAAAPAAPRSLDATPAPAKAPTAGVAVAASALPGTRPLAVVATPPGSQLTRAADALMPLARFAARSADPVPRGLTARSAVHDGIRSEGAKRPSTVPSPAAMPVLAAAMRVEPLAVAWPRARRSVAAGTVASRPFAVLPPGSLLDRPTANANLPPPMAQSQTATAYSNRFGPAKAHALETFGGSEATERAVADGLRYLARKQNDDGTWGDRSDFDAKYGHVYVGKTALCLLAFLGAGHTPESATEHSEVVRRALVHLLTIQDPATGAFGRSSAYGHGIATYALAECYGLTKAAVLKRPLEDALAWIVQNQGPRPDRRNRGGWGYFSPGLRAEDDYARVSVSAWMVMALESARLSGVDLPPTVLPRAREFLELAFDQRNGWFRYNHNPSRLQSAWPTLPASTPAGAFCLLLLGAADDDAMVRAATEFTVDRRPEEYRTYGDDDFVLRGQGNVYFWYYGTLCCFLAGGDTWQRWNERLRTVLPGAQGADGSWAPIDVYAREAGDNRRDHSYTTAMCVLSLEVYYRYFTPLLLGR